MWLIAKFAILMIFWADVISDFHWVRIFVCVIVCLVQSNIEHSQATNHQIQPDSKCHIPFSFDTISIIGNWHLDKVCTLPPRHINNNRQQQMQCVDVKSAHKNVSSHAYTQIMTPFIPWLFNSLIFAWAGMSVCHHGIKAEIDTFRTIISIRISHSSLFYWRIFFAVSFLMTITK